MVVKKRKAHARERAGEGQREFSVLRPGIIFYELLKNHFSTQRAWSGGAATQADEPTANGRE
jgi:hypothetical protein